MDADPADQQRLLELQELDSGLARLAARRKALPEIAELTSLVSRLAELDDDGVRARTEVSDLARAQSRLDGDVEVVRSRTARDEARMASGAAPSKELVDLTSEVESLRRRQAVLEDEELEVMQAREDAEARLTAVDSARTEALAAQSAARARLAAGRAELDSEVGLTTTRREQVAPTVPEDLRALYDTLRPSHGGVGAAALVRGRCSGCHLELSGPELRTAATAPATQVLRCESCRRILVRTVESGL